MTKEEHLLVCLAEECAEVQQAVAKALRFGLYDKNPDTNVLNREHIAAELVDLKAVWLLLLNGHSIPCIKEDCAIDLKQSKVLKWMNYAESQGTLDKE